MTQAEQCCCKQYICVFLTPKSKYLQQEGRIDHQSQLTFYQFLLLAVSFGFWKSHHQAIKNTGRNNLNTAS
jgi:hypothetical protein